MNPELAHALYTMAIFNARHGRAPTPAAIPPGVAARLEAQARIQQRRDQLNGSHIGDFYKAEFDRQASLRPLPR
jgi:hypothetical protein